MKSVVGKLQLSCESSVIAFMNCPQVINNKKIRIKTYPTQVLFIQQSFYKMLTIHKEICQSYLHIELGLFLNSVTLGKFCYFTQKSIQFLHRLNRLLLHVRSQSRLSFATSQCGGVVEFTPKLL